MKKKKKYFILDPKGEYYSSDRTKRFNCLSGQALYEYLQSQEAKGKFFFETDFDENTIYGVEVPSEEVVKFRKEKNRAYYRVLVMKKLDISFTSLEVMVDAESEIVSGEEALALMRVDVEDEIIRRATYKELHMAISKLPKPERILIKALFFKGYTQRQLARKYGISQVAIHKRKERILEKLKKFLEEI